MPTVVSRPMVLLVFRVCRTYLCQYFHITSKIRSGTCLQDVVDVVARVAVEFRRPGLLDVLQHDIQLLFTTMDFR